MSVNDTAGGHNALKLPLHRHYQVIRDADGNVCDDKEKLDAICELINNQSAERYKIAMDNIREYASHLPLHYPVPPCGDVQHSDYKAYYSQQHIAHYVQRITNAVIEIDIPINPLTTITEWEVLAGKPDIQCVIPNDNINQILHTVVYSFLVLNRDVHFVVSSECKMALLLGIHNLIRHAADQIDAGGSYYRAFGCHLIVTPYNSELDEERLAGVSSKKLTVVVSDYNKLSERAKSILTPTELDTRSFYFTSTESNKNETTL